MDKTSQRIASLFTLIFMAQALWGCGSPYTTLAGFTPSPGQEIPIPAAASAAPPAVEFESPDPAYNLAQATRDAGQSQLLDLARKATEVSLSIAQAAKSAALSTQDYNQRRKLDLDFQATLVSLNIAQAVATQKFISQQTKIAHDSTAAAQNQAEDATRAAGEVNAARTEQAQAVLDKQAGQTAQAAAALTAYPLTVTYAAHLLNVTETVQARLILNAMAVQATQQAASLTAYPLTATPLAVTQAALLMEQYDREQQSFVDRVVIPYLPFLAAFVLVLAILVIILAYRRYLLRPGIRRPLFARLNDAPATRLPTIDATFSDPEPAPYPAIPAEVLPANLPPENPVHVEIVDPNEAPFAHWIAEVEQQMAIDGGPSA